MKNTKNLVFGIGNPLIDLVIPATDDDLVKLDINKGTMALVDQERQIEISDYFKPIKFNDLQRIGKPNDGGYIVRIKDILDTEHLISI